MSNHTHAVAGHDGPAHGSLRGYVAGFLLSVVLTVIPFWLVMGHVIGSAQTTSYLIMALAAVQMVVHMVFFLHMDTRSEHGWTFLALIFTLVLVAIALIGSLWVMYHMNSNMMPMPPHSMHNMRNMQNMP